MNPLEKIYRDYKHPAGLSSVNKLYKAAKEIDPNVKHIDVKNFLEGIDSYTLHKPARRKYPTNMVVAPSTDANWQMDLSDVSHLAAHNDGVHFLLFIIDIYSRYLWIIPLKNKTSAGVATALEEVFRKYNRIPGSITSDCGTEFLGRNVQTMLSKYNVGFSTANSTHKACVVERVQRTIKSRITKYFHSLNTYRYVDVLDEFVECYNNTLHRTINNTPESQSHSDSFSKHVKLEIARRKKRRARRKTPLFKINDYVRVNLNKKIFEKGYEASWSSEIFLICEVLLPDRTHNEDQTYTMYRIRDMLNEPIIGRFHEHELQRVKYSPDTMYLVEKIIKVHKNKKGVKTALVKWLGWPSKFNSEIPYDEIHQAVHI